MCPVLRWRNAVECGGRCVHIRLAGVQVDDLVVAMDEGLREAASGIAQQLRRAGRRVDLVLEAKKMKWVFKVS
jgi:histidyl-tRNA synthetase